jgi:hypothetical protein
MTLLPFDYIQWRSVKWPIRLVEAGDVLATRGQGSVSVASQGLCFMCIIQRHDQTSNICPSRTGREANPQDSEGHHTHTHTHKYKDNTQRLTFAPVNDMEEKPQGR